MQLTTLYRTSLSSAKRSYASGYAQSLQDILDVVLLRLQQPPSSAPGYPSHIHHHSQHAADSNREELLWLVRYLRARIEATKAESEDEEDRESEEEVEDVQSGQASSSKMVRGQSAPVKTASSSALPGQARSADEQTRDDDAVEVQVASKAEEKSQQDEDSSSPTPTVISAAVPSTTFSFTRPSQTAQDFSIAPIVTRNSPQGTVRRKFKGGASMHGSSNNIVATTIVPPHSASSISSEEEATVVQPLTPSKRLSGRLGKRTAGRDKASAVVSAKRRRGMGDRREDDRRDGGLH
jgi:hypothetical protein